MKSINISVISLIIVSLLLMLQRPAFSQQLYILQQNNGTIEQAPVKDIILKFDNNGRLIQTKRGIEKGILFSSVKLIFFVEKINTAPISNAGTDLIANEGASVSLNGSLSSDPDGDPLTYKWTAPAGITLSSSTAQKPTFTAPEVTSNTDFIFSLVVNDGTVDSPAGQVVITVKNVNKAPVANAGFDQTVNEAANVTLDGSLSSDPDSDPLTYKWTAPAGITLSSATAQKPTFTAPEVKQDTTYSISLVVNDGTVDSPPSTMKVTVLNVIKVSADIAESSAFKVYPNPTNGEITIELAQRHSLSSEIVILNSIGSVVLRKQITDQELSFDLSDLVSGLYLIKLKEGDQYFMSKILIQK